MLQPGDTLKFDLEPIVHYNEPNLGLSREYDKEKEAMYILEFNPQNGEWWSTSKQEALEDASKSLTIDKVERP